MGFRTARKAAGLSVRDVCKALNVSDAAVYQWETGVTTPTASRLKQLAQLYHCSVDQLLAVDEESV